MTGSVCRPDSTSTSIFAIESDAALKTLSELACAKDAGIKEITLSPGDSKCCHNDSCSLRSLNSEFHHMLTWRIWADGDGDWSDLCELYLQRSQKSIQARRFLVEQAEKHPHIAAGEPVKRKLLIPDLCESDSDSEMTEPEILELLPFKKRVCRGHS